MANENSDQCSSAELVFLEFSEIRDQILRILEEIETLQEIRFSEISSVTIRGFRDLTHEAVCKEDLRNIYCNFRSILVSMQDGIRKYREAMEGVVDIDLIEDNLIHAQKLYLHDRKTVHLGRLAILGFSMAGLYKLLQGDVNSILEALLLVGTAYFINREISEPEERLASRDY